MISKATEEITDNKIKNDHKIKFEISDDDKKLLRNKYINDHVNNMYFIFIGLIGGIIITKYILK
jgi:hypothetical protein